MTITVGPVELFQIEELVLHLILSKLVEPVNQSDWSKLLTRVEFALNNTIYRTTKCSPSELLFGIVQRGPVIDSLTEHLEEKFNATKYRCLEIIRESAAKRITDLQTKNEPLFAGRSKKPREYSENDFVVMRYVNTSVGSNKKT